jgi:hypothetical protein
LGAGLPGVFTLVDSGPKPHAEGAGTLTVLILSTLFGLVASVRTRRSRRRPRQLLAALREDDFQLRRTANPDDPMGAALMESTRSRNASRTALGAVEATALLRTVMEQIDVAVLAFDPEPRLRLVNRPRWLMGKGMEHARTDGRGLSLTGWFGDAPRVVDISPPGGGPGRWEVRRTVPSRWATARFAGAVGRGWPLRERSAGMAAAVRVIGHELNLGADQIDRGSPGEPVESQSDARRLAGRHAEGASCRVADGLVEPLQAHPRLARLPAPARSGRP